MRFIGENDIFPANNVDKKDIVVNIIGAIAGTLTAFLLSYA